MTDSAMAGDTAGPSESDRLPQTSWSIPFEDIHLEESIGSGGFGEVWRGVWDGTQVAVKRVWISPREAKDVMQAFETEIKVLKALRHPNIVLFLGACTEQKNPCMVMEYVRGGNLRKLLSNEKVAIPMSLRVRMAADTARALLYLHKKHIIHRDLKTYNLLVDDQIRIKVCDFGIARVKSAQIMSMKGTTDWMAPEVAHGMPYDEKADVFSFGVILAELVTRAHPDELPRRGFMRLEFDVPKLKDMFPPDLPEDLGKLCLACVQVDPAARPSMDAIGEALFALERTMPSIDTRVLTAIQTAIGVAAPPASLTGSLRFSLLPRELLLSSDLSALSLGDDASDAFWSKNFGTAFEADWSAFCAACVTELGVSDTDVSACQDLLVTTGEDKVVTKRQLAAFLNWFKPLKTGIERAAKLAEKSWFHGFMSTAEAARFMKDKPAGAYLVRLNEEIPGTYIISFVKDGGGIGNALVQYTAKGYSSDSKRYYKTLDDLLFTHSTKSLRVPLPPVRRSQPQVSYDEL